MGPYEFQNSVLFEIWNRQKEQCKKSNDVFGHIIHKICGDTPSDEIASQVSDKVQNFCKGVKQRWSKCSRNLSFFQKNNESWLNSKMIINIEKQKLASNLPQGRPRISFEEKSARGKRREAGELAAAAGNQPSLLVLAATTAARRGGQVNLAGTLKNAVESPSMPSKIRKISTEPTTTAPIKLTADEAVAFLLEQNFTKEQYCAIRRESKMRNCDIYPHYNELAAAKLKCRPENIKVTETCANVLLQSLLEHTAHRIVKMQTEVVEIVMNREKKTNLEAKLILNYGFDSSSGHSQYKQGFQDRSSSLPSDSSILATTIMPLRFLASSGKILWNNSSPQSIRFCRPLKLEYTNETEAVILKEHLEVKKQIENLNKIQINIGEDKIVHVTFELHLTAIDGKVLNVLTGTKSSLSCPICGAKPKDFKGITNYSSEKFSPKKSALKYGISPLHCWIRFFEYVIHAGYKCDIKKWQIRSKDDKEAVQKRKERIQKDFWTKLSLRVDRPKVGGSGNTNDGNTARRAFAEPELFSAITGISQDVIFHLKTILICLSCQLPLNEEKFQNYCFQTADLILASYPWLPMTPTVHKVLIHSKQIIENTILPLGCFGEDASESRHKIYKADRLHHARKNNRINNMQDVFHRSMDTSDPLISSIYLKNRIQRRKRAPLPPEVIEMLKCYPDAVHNKDEDNSNDEEDDDVVNNYENYEEDNMVLENEEDVCEI